MPIASITSKGQVTIPKSVRDSLRLRTGDRVEFELAGRAEAVIRPITKSIDEVFGSLHQPGRRARSVDDMRKAVSRKLKDRNR